MQTRTASTDAIRPAVPEVPLALKLKQLTKIYGSHRAVNGLELSIHRGEQVALLGPNGAGKSTTVNMVLGLTRIDSGQVEVLGMQPREAIARGLIGAMLQD